MQNSTGIIKYNGAGDCAKQVLREGGLRSLYRGSFATLLRDVPGCDSPPCGCDPTRSGAYFVGYEGARRAMVKEGQTMNDLNAGQLLFAGGMAGILNWLVAIPADVLKSRFQTAEEGRYRGIVDVYKYAPGVTLR